MQETTETISDLIYDYLAGILSPDDQVRLDSWIREIPENRAFFTRLVEGNAIRHGVANQLRRNEAAHLVLDQIIAGIPATRPVPAPVRRFHYLKTAWFRYAAILLLLAGTATYLYQTYRDPLQELVQYLPSKQSTDIAPGGDKATLTLSDGSVIVLDSAANGSLASQGTTQILKTADGILSYQSGAVTSEVLYNTISTPNGGQYQVRLPDGSKVWLNAASSIRFPATFSKDRKVTIEGEAYLEVVKDKSKPFHVQVGEMNVAVLGTSFNINAYRNETTIKTTLIEGRVQVSARRRVQTLEPGQQAQVSQGNDIKLLRNADIEKVMAWKNGLFNFNGADLPTVIHQLERWYDIQISYSGDLPKIEFQGELNRGVPLSDIVHYFRKIGINCRIEGRKLIIL